VLARVWGIPFLPAVAVLLVRQLRRGNAEARTIAAGGFVMIGVALIEIVFQLLDRGTIFPAQIYAFTLFAVSMTFSLSNRFSRVHGDLDMLRLQLEDMVEDRAAELSTANQRLRSEISERELAQEAMHMLERAVEQSIDGILVADLGENILFVNEAWARLHGREPFEIFGRRLELFHSGEQIERQVRPALDRVRETGSWEGEIEHRGKDGSDFPTWTSVTLLRDPEAQPVGFVMVTRDITEKRRAAEDRRRIETRIQEAEKLR
ncbi:MAG: PAS domain S-box protein, partial [bacterium]|nr:PAS domain S-box protein [bacterium]